MSKFKTITVGEQKHISQCAALLKEVYNAGVLPKILYEKLGCSVNENYISMKGDIAKILKREGGK